MEELKKAGLFIGNMLSIFLGEDLPDPRVETDKNYPFFYYW